MNNRAKHVYISDEEPKKHLKVTSERSRKPTMAREWRKLKEKKKSKGENDSEKKFEKIEVNFYTCILNTDRILIEY